MATRTKTKAVAKTETPNLPAVRTTPASEITAEDLALPRLYKGEPMSDAVQNGLVGKGDLYLASGKDDPSPNIVAKAGETGVEDGVVFHVIGLKKGKSVTIDGQLETFAFDDPNAPEDAWVTYMYAIVLPEVDEELPAKLLLTRTSKPAAQAINLVLKRSEAIRPAAENAFVLTTAARQNAKGRYFIYQVKQIEPTKANLKVVSKFENFDFGGAPAATQQTDAPEI